MKKISLALVVVMAISYILSIASLAYYNSFSGLYDDFVLFTNDSVYGSLTLRITQAGELNGTYFEAEGKYKWAVRNGTTDQMQNHATLKIKGTVYSFATCTGDVDSAMNTATFYGNNITTSTSRTITAYNDAYTTVLFISNRYEYYITSTIDGSFIAQDYTIKNLNYED